jgi:hypothetical protein
VDHVNIVASGPAIVVEAVDEADSEVVAANVETSVVEGAADAADHREVMVRLEVEGVTERPLSHHPTKPLSSASFAKCIASHSLHIIITTTTTSITSTITNIFTSPGVILPLSPPQPSRTRSPPRITRAGIIPPASPLPDDDAHSTSLLQPILTYHVGAWAAYFTQLRTP